MDRQNRLPAARFRENPARNLVLGLFYMLAVMVAATGAYVAAGWSLGDAAYMVLITVYTVGYGEVRPVDTTVLRAITMATILLGCTGVIFLTGALVQFITLNQLDRILGSRRMTQQIDALEGHVIICGFGRIGAMLAQDLRAARGAFVILERDEGRVAEARDLGFLALAADATEESALLAAGILRARTLATVLPNDAANVFITLSARNLCPGLDIIARGEAPSTERKLLHAGANRVVLPAHIGAERIAEMILYEKTADFLRGSEAMRDFERSLHALGLNLEVLTAAPGSPAVGLTVSGLEQAAQSAFFVVQINRPDGAALNQPPPGTRVAAGDGLLLLGRTLGARELFEPGGRAGFRRSAR